MTRDTLSIAADVKRLTMPYQTIAAAYKDCGSVPNTMAAGYALGYSDAVHDVLLLLSDTPPDDPSDPPKASGSAAWSEAARKWWEHAEKDKYGCPYVS